LDRQKKVKMLSVLRSGALRTFKPTKEYFKFYALVSSRNAGGAVIKKDDGDYVPPKYEEPKKYTMQEEIEIWDYVNSVYFGPERDHKNFPLERIPELTPKTRLGFIPSSWFDFYAQKTGVLGPYCFLTGLYIFLGAKEFNPVDHYYYELFGFGFAMWFYQNHPMIGQNVRRWFDVVTQREDENIYHRPLMERRVGAQEKMTKLERLIEECEISKYYKQAKEESIQLQLEAAYRERLQHVYNEVKNRLDYEAEKTSAQRKFEQDHMVNWIVSNVRKSITPQQEKESIKSCIQALKQLASKQPAMA